MTRLFVATAVAVLGLTTTATGQSPDKPTRELFRNNEPILSRIGAADRFVTIQTRDSFEGLEGPHVYPSAELELLDLAANAEILVIHGVQEEPHFVDNGTWVKTTVTAIVDQVLKSTRLAAYPGLKVTFELEGGELMVKGTRILAGLTPIFSRQSNLVALYFDEDLSGWRLVRLFEISADRKLKPHHSKGSNVAAESKLHGKTLDEIALVVAKRNHK